MKTKKITFNGAGAGLSVESLADDKPIGSVFLPAGTWTVTIDYPLSENYIFKVKGPISGYDLAIKVAKEYVKIYKDIEKWGVWGHYLGDLVVEGFIANFDKKTVEVLIGS